MSIFDWFKVKNGTLKDPQWTQEMFRASTASGASITHDNALEIGAVYACVRILAETVASLPLKVYQQVGDERQVVDDHPLSRVLGQVSNNDQTAFELREYMMASLCLRGNAYAYVRRNTRGQVVEIIPLDAARIVLSRNNAGRLAFDYHNETSAFRFEQEEVWRIAGMGKNGVVGLSPISLARESLGIAVSAERSAGKLFSNGNQSQIALEFPSMMTQEQADRLREQWASQYAGTDNAHKPVILEGGMTAKSLGMTAGDAQFLESRKWQIAEIARWFRVPLHMLNELDRATFSNIEHQSIEFVQHTIRPWLVRIEQTISRDLLNQEERRRGYYVAHSVEGILRGDTASRYDAYGKAINDGWMSRNEVRKLENLNAADGLDEYLTPLNMATAGESEQADPVDEVANAENKVLKLESGRELGDFANWCVKFFDRQERRLAEAGIPHEGYAEKRIARIASLDSVEAAIDELVAHTKSDIEAQTNE